MAHRRSKKKLFQVLIVEPKKKGYPDFYSLSYTDDPKEAMKGYKEEGWSDKPKGLRAYLKFVQVK